MPEHRISSSKNSILSKPNNEFLASLHAIAPLFGVMSDDDDDDDEVYMISCPWLIVAPTKLLERHNIAGGSPSSSAIDELLPPFGSVSLLGHPEGQKSGPAS